MNDLAKGSTIWLRTGLWLNPDFSGFAGFRDLPVVMLGKPPVSRTCQSSCRGNHRFPGLASRHVGETTGFPDLPVVMSGKPPVSRTCGSSCRGNHRFPGLVGRHVGETTGFPDLPVVMSGKPPV